MTLFVFIQYTNTHISMMNNGWKLDRRQSSLLDGNIFFRSVELSSLVDSCSARGICYCHRVPSYAIHRQLLHFCMP